ncbi:mechanosensitive ion channel family protein [Sulfobacillus sp. hq2]|uniref:mechanosensitive ion channel family protein n=1 Tax=Sulfobacillus TaxID=28033 RepID=UPI000CD07FBD|nr:mechanosensitive ion channel family protein [Sulfobacillus sp. hq2]POB12078.1 mechanosensitive ion channel protein MscS [Sulfobacillus sp. hq2]
MHWPPHMLWDLAESAVIILVASIFLRVMARVFKHMETGRTGKPSQRKTTIARLLTSVVRYVTDFVVIVMVLGRFHVQTTSLIAGAGILGLAVSFGAQGLVQDVVTGIFLLYEDQFGVGDHVTFPALTLSGTVQEVGIRITRLTGLSGETVIVPNRLILEVKNYSRGSLGVSVVIPVSADENPDRVRRALDYAVQNLQDVVPGASLVGITGFSNGTVEWTISASATLATQSAASRDIREYVAQAFYDEHIHFAGMGKGPVNYDTSSVSN